MVDHLVSLEKAIEYIEQHLYDELSMEDIAKAGGYSLYHLIHIFTAVIGEPIGSYIQKRRLSNAAKMLLNSKKRIIDIAIESGFGSSEAFSRAFKSLYGTWPSTYRKNRVDLYVGTKKMLDKETLQHLANGVSIMPSILDIDKVLVAGIRGETSVLQNILPELWKRLYKILDSAPALLNSRHFGICETDRMKTAFSEDGNILFSEMVGVEIDDTATLPKGLEIRTIQGGRYAVFTHTGTIATLRKTYDYIWGSWALFTKETLDDREDFEVYDERFHGADHLTSQIDIYVPIK